MIAVQEARVMTGADVITGIVGTEEIVAEGHLAGTMTVVDRSVNNI